MDIFHKILKDYWGYTEFRPLQEDIIRSIAGGKDTLGLMPTGGGKSLTFQVPALAVEGICLVITPLIALMKDQVDNLKHIGIKATTVYSGMEHQNIIIQLENCIFGDYKFLYISPERLASDLFRSKLKAMNVSFLVVDESHCISQWGYDFRPSYLSIASIRELLPGVPVLALTATATPKVVEDIQEKLHFREKNVFSKSFLRENLSYIVRHVEVKNNQLINILNRVEGSSIVYVRSRQRTQETANVLKDAGISAEYYHAGLNTEEKNRRQNMWKKGDCRVMVATNAFGMGIDKPDVRTVIHIDMPSSLEEYFQEAGRAGRDGNKAYAVVLCSDRDGAKLKKRMSDEFPDRDYIYNVYESLGNFFQIAVGYGFESMNDFSINDFCHAYKFSILQAHHSLKILELAGYIEYQEEAHNVSRLMFIVTREELYKYIQKEKQTDEILQTILRYYTGLFADYVFIDESVVATRSGCSQRTVYETLISLSKRRIINYIPKKKTALIIYSQSREEQKYLNIPHTAYETRKERLEKRIENVLEYITNDSKCRSRMLLKYFGEKEASDCGVCDICLAKNKSVLSDSEFKSILDEIIKHIENSPVPVTELMERLSFPTEKTLRVIRFLADNDKRFLLNEGSLSLRS